MIGCSKNSISVFSGNVNGSKSRDAGKQGTERRQSNIDSTSVHYSTECNMKVQTRKHISAASYI